MTNRDIARHAFFIPSRFLSFGSSDHHSDRRQIQAGGSLAGNESSEAICTASGAERLSAFVVSACVRPASRASAKRPLRGAEESSVVALCCFGIVLTSYANGLNHEMGEFRGRSRARFCVTWRSISFARRLPRAHPPKKASPRRLERCLPYQGTRPTLKCDYPAPTGPAQP